MSYIKIFLAKFQIIHYMKAIYKLNILNMKIQLARLFSKVYNQKLSA